MDFKSLKTQVASPEKILSWSHGEVTKPETINYRTQRPERDGLFSERIFGPTKDYECYCGKYKKIRYKGIKCDKCGVDVTKSSVRRERMGHIVLAAPVSHIWFLKSVPSRIGLFIDAPIQKLARVIYYAAYIVMSVNEDNKKRILEEIDKEFKARKKTIAKEKTKEFEEEAKKTKDLLASISVGKILNEAEYFSLSKKFSTVFEAGSGAEAIRKILEKINLEKEAVKIEKEIKSGKDSIRQKKLLYKLKIINSFAKNKMRPEWLIFTVLPILPPDLRPMVALDGGRYATSDLNDLYRRVINRNNRLKKLLEIKAPEIIVTNEKRMLQEAVDSLIDNSARFGSQQQMSSQRRPLKSLADILKGKEGRFRQNLLGKRVDYSGRSVIVVGPELPLDTCGLPKKMALELFKPFVISEIIKRGMAYNIRNANRLIDTATPEIWGILEEVIKDKKVLLNRAPTLHRLGIQAFKPILIEDLAIRIPPMVCTAFNADFDGDQMAVHLPLSEEAQKEASELMLASGNILKPANGDPVAQPTQDIVLGCYFLTRIKDENEKETKKMKTFFSPEEAIMACEFDSVKINELIKVRLPEIEELIATSVGRLIFNKIVPEDFGFVNKTMDNKELGKFLSGLIDKYGLKDIWKILDEIKKLGFKYSAYSGVSWGMNDLIVPLGKNKIVSVAEKEVNNIKEQFEEGLLTDAERHTKIISIWDKAKDEIAKVVPKTLDPNGSVYSIINSGSRGSWSQPIQMMGMKGLVANPQGETIELPIKSSYKEGLSVLEFFINTHGARKGLTDTALKTAQAGYLTRRLVDVSQDLIIREEDCKTIKGRTIVRKDGDDYGVSFSQRIFGRAGLNDIKVGNKVLVKVGEIISRQVAQAIENSSISQVEVRSPMECKAASGICSKCYGYDLSKTRPIEIGEAVGVVAAQSIGEPGTQLTLRTFHTGGVAGVDITHGLQRIQELFEVRIPKGKAYLAEADGVIEDIEQRKNLKVILLKIVDKKKKAKIVEYSVASAAAIFIKPKDRVSIGDQLCEGSIDLQELFKFKGKETTERYIINEVQRIYASEGSAINDKHLEIIVKQMFSRVMIKESGDTNFVPGEIIEKGILMEANREMKKKGKNPSLAKQLLMGITKVSLTTSSFLSAASFQETARVLVAAASEAKEDKLKGLKESVIIGRLIPAGTGIKKEL